MSLFEEEAVTTTEDLETEFLNRWYEKDNIVYFSITSDGTTGPEWIKHLDKRYIVSGNTREMLHSEAFQPTDSVVHHLAMVKKPTARDLAPTQWTIQRANAIAHKHGFGKVHPEVACLLRDQFTSSDIERMGVECIIAMHRPLRNRGGNLHILRSNSSGMDSLFHKCSGVRCRACGMVYAVPPALKWPHRK